LLESDGRQTKKTQQGRDVPGGGSVAAKRTKQEIILRRARDNKIVFLYWVRKYRDEHEPDGFVPLTSGGALSLMQNYSIEIHYPNGVVLKLPANTPVSLVRHYVGQ
jgi:hypothetical protein